MPKIAVVFFGAESPAASLADAAAEGASVRFMEVDRFAGGRHDQPTRRGTRVLDAPDVLASYDGVVIACQAAGEIPAELDALLAALERLAPDDAFVNTVFAVIGGENTPLVARVHRLGGLVLSAPRGFADPEARAKALGARLAKVVGWVRHALGHEAQAHHHH